MVLGEAGKRYGLLIGRCATKKVLHKVSGVEMLLPPLPQVFPANPTLRSTVTGGGDLWDTVLTSIGMLS
mgnify:CR=1 FL=1